MKRFWWGLVVGGVAGALTYLVTDVVSFALYVGGVMAALVWFTRIGEVVEEAGEAFFEALGRID